MNTNFKTIAVISVTLVLLNCKENNSYPREMDRKNWIEVKTDIYQEIQYPGYIHNDTMGPAGLPNHLYSEAQMLSYLCSKRFADIDWIMNDILIDHFDIFQGWDLVSYTVKVWINPQNKQYFVQIYIKDKKAFNSGAPQHYNSYTLLIRVPKIPANFKKVSM